MGLDMQHTYIQARRGWEGRSESLLLFRSLRAEWCIGTYVLVVLVVFFFFFIVAAARSFWEGRSNGEEEVVS